MAKDASKTALGGHSPYGKANLVQTKDPAASIPLYWSAINTGDRVDDALQEMVIVMKQLNRTDEAIEAIKSFRGLCSPDAQYTLDLLIVDEAVQDLCSQGSLDPLVDDEIMDSKNILPYDAAKKLESTDTNRAIYLFWSAINADDRVYGALKGMTALMEEMDRADEAIEAILSFRHLCSSLSQELLNIRLTDLYKSAGRSEEKVDAQDLTEATEATSQLKEVAHSAKQWDRARKPKNKKIQNVTASPLTSSDEDSESSDEEKEEWEDNQFVVVRSYRNGVQENECEIDIRRYPSCSDFIKNLKVMYNTEELSVTYSAAKIPLFTVDDIRWMTFEPPSISVWLS